ncbi:phenylalanine--tRNA ligase subunit alpha [Coxiella burnetii]|nr:phenylalanine--tRNA ligase subunit alpha [Coxiella burnetii]B6J7X7.1 RecName: Full=Phenylalanine--tRNA ligase alpha subunit; AltName: Full=Phenylalanyl-tRNA synthetase alpha subunit; Short=PheRS [Coxiella burnetii CbuK_Q154]ACJ20376.1 phenylalanyl-tRNA synthetase alpha chain [Coxiella burnetii CbuK_Q154]AIT63444.1 Phenylalanine--tRNA ligase alpha subunit [Coxiella burnetii str. Namibia]ATN86017.1 phenylalanine--tRNA ligase subunit alpha [Coxiella burnetii str. Schperling]EAX33210.1 phenylal
MQNQLNALLQSAKKSVADAQSEIVLEEIRVDYLGKKGKLTELLKSVGQMPADQRPLLGKAVNEIKREIQQLLNAKSTQLREKSLQEKLNKEKVDITLRGRYDHLGAIHPISRVSERVSQLFSMLGFQIAEGPEIENEYYNFEALNIPADHPARTMADTFYFSGDKLLRTHTSPVQIREMEKQGVPIRLIALGRVYRRDLDQTHTPMFHQVEGLVIDKRSTFANLKGLLQQFLNCFFEKDVRLRFRPSYFPFTEPSAEVDIYQPRTDKWLEVLGCGMVHPNVLRNLNIDPDEYSGFAFGIGLDRLAMLRYEVTDLRLFFENDLRFLGQFK